MNDRDRDDLLSVATDRFERRLAEEGASLRNEIGQLRVDMMGQGSDLRREVSDVRLEVSKLRLDMAEQFGEMKADASAKHVELLKWALVFWVGQAASVAAIIRVLR